MKLILKKQKIASLSNSEMNDITGGGVDRSNRLGTACNYSREHNHTYTVENPYAPGGCQEITACVSSNSPFYK